MSETSLYSTIIETTHALIVVLDTEGRIVMFNNACERLTGYRFEEVKGRHIWDFLLLPEETEGVKAAFNDLTRGQFPNTHANFWITKAGERRWIEWSNSAVTNERGEAVHIIGTGIDVTEKRAAEQALRQSEARFQALCDNALDITAIVASDKTIRFITPSVKRILGYACEDLIGRKCFDICHSDDVTATEAAFQRAIDNPGTVTAVTRRMRHADGSWINFESFWISLLADPHINGIVVTSRDVTGRVRAQQTLREAQGRERALLDSIPYAAWLKDAAGRYIAVNQAFRDRFGDDFPDPAGKTNRDIFPAETATKQTAEDQEVVRTRMSLRLERQMRIGEGNERWIEVIKVPVIDESGDVIGITGVAHDVTERKLAEAQRIARNAAQREALVKEVHHRIKNNLQGTITLIQETARGHPESAGLLKIVSSRLDAVASVHGLYGATGERELRLEQIIPRLVSSLQSFHDHLPLRLSVSNPDSAPVSENEIVPLALIINELIMNAIKHSRATVDGHPVEVALEGAGNGVRIVIRSPLGRFPRDFNFDAGAGLGSGLSLVKSLLPPDGALLRFENAPGPGGTRVELTLRPPVIALSPAVTSSTIAAREPLHGAHSDH